MITIFGLRLRLGYRVRFGLGLVWVGRIGLELGLELEVSDRFVR